MVALACDQLLHAVKDKVRGFPWQSEQMEQVESRFSQVRYKKNEHDWSKSRLQARLSEPSIKDMTSGAGNAYNLHYTGEDQCM